MSGYLKVKRAFDVAVSLIVLMVSFPIQLVAAGAILLSMGKPVFFRQQRPGLNGEPFMLIKFRSMRPMNPSRGWSDDASRLTKVGKFVRTTSIDELPTLWNVLRGDMSLVGPRPLRMKYLDRYTTEQARRHDVRPGLTGLAQVSGRNSLSWEQRFALDVEYVDNRSLLMDLKILVRTVAVVLKRDGISADGHVTMTEFMGSEKDGPAGVGDTEIRASGERSQDVAVREDTGTRPSGEDKQGLTALASRLRSTAAGAMTKGRLESIADEVQKALADSDKPANREVIDHIVAHAVESVPYYQQLAIPRLEDLPVMDKNTMRAQQDQFLSVHEDRENLASSSTSGSTGVPFTAYFDAGKKLRHRGGLVGTYRFMGADPYGPLVHNRHWPALSKKQRLVFALKGQLPFSGTHHDSRTPAQVGEWIQKRKGVTIMGYASYVESLMRAFEQENIEFAPGEVTSVIAGSEPATKYLEAGSDRLFGVSPDMRYSNIEIGMLGVTGDDLDVYHLDTSSFHVEILEENSNKPVPAGEQGRIVVTDLYNRAMPFLRYDTGDLGRFPLDSTGAEQRGKLTDIKGRRLDVLVAGTVEAPRKAHPLQVWGATAQIENLQQFQLRQHDVGNFTWILNTEKSPELEAKLRAILDEHIGDIRECRFEYAEGVPVLASGKRQFFVNEVSNIPELLGEGATDG